MPVTHGVASSSLVRPALKQKKKTFEVFFFCFIRFAQFLLSSVFAHKENHSRGGFADDVHKRPVGVEDDGRLRH